VQSPPPFATTEGGAITCFAWHKHKSIFAIALADDTVKIYDLTAERKCHTNPFLEANHEQDGMMFNYRTPSRPILKQWNGSQILVQYLLQDAGI